MKKTKILLIIAFFGCILCRPLQGLAVEEEGQDILFVVDVSYSMTTHDPNKHIFEGIQTMGALSAESNDRIGYVLYNDSIAKDQNLTEIKQNNVLDGWMNGFRAITPVKGTDVGLGLKTAQRIMDVSEARKNHSMIILLSDGDTETDSANPNRSQQDVDHDIQSVLNSLDYPLYVVQYSEVENLNKEPMTQWPDQTDGKFYSVKNSQQLAETILDIYSHQTKMSTEKDSLESEAQDNQRYNLTIPIPESDTQRVKEMVVTMQSEGQIKELVYEESKGMTVQESGNQVMIKLKNPTKKNYSLTYQTENNQPVMTTTLTKMMDIPEETEINQNFPWLSLVIGVLLLGGVTILFVFLRKQQKNRIPEKNEAYFFADALEGCFVKTPNDEEIPIQSWPANIFQRQKTITLYDLLCEEDIHQQMPESKKVQFQVGKENTLKMRLKGNVEGIQQGREIPKGVWVTLSLQRGAYLIFKEDELELDIHIRKKSS